MYRKTIVTATLILGAATTSLAWAGDPRAGEQKMQACIACHGETGVGDDEQYPILAGQHEDYLYHTLKAYQTGERDDPIMAGQVANLSDQDMRDLAAYYAAQDVEDGVFTTRINRGVSID